MTVLLVLLAVLSTLAGIAAMYVGLMIGMMSPAPSKSAGMGWMIPGLIVFIGSIASLIYLAVAG